ncbi:tetratricopeptide repeat protein [Iningainema tapete]|uniref:Tetratricopeptide repeat protein n=1 Tax=Iningainema tapete BLCC-T55 TaxID=2748662 RepID=A0A8J6XIM6_9CYAN|nr:tetratricopeptide repeat protein [Iningainema tapete BLCC-T55]
MPKRIGLISILVICGLLSTPRDVYAQALIPHTLQLDVTKLEQQGLSLAQEAAQLAQFQQYEIALPRARLASQLAPKNDKVWLLLGGLYLQTKNLDNAITALKQAQSLNPKNGDIHFALGSAHFQQQKYSEAIGYFQTGLNLKPNDPEGLFDLGNAYYMVGKKPEALVQYKKAVSFNKKFWPAINNVGLILYEQGDLQGAMKQWQQAIPIAKALKQPESEPLLALAVAMYTRGNQQQALAMGEAALRIDERYGDLDFLKQNLWGERLLSDTKKFLSLPRIQAALGQRENSSQPRRTRTQ